jgi:hypothetical protein
MQRRPPDYDRRDVGPGYQRPVIPAYGPEADRSTSLSRTSPALHTAYQSPSRSNTPRSYRTRTPRMIDRNHHVPTEQSMASDSLTSIYNMYRGPAPCNSMASLYYDSSENFEATPLEQVPTLCPVPQRTGSLSRPMVLRAEEDQSLDSLGAANLDNWKGIASQALPEQSSCSSFRRLLT